MKPAFLVSLVSLVSACAVDEPDNPTVPPPFGGGSGSGSGSGSGGGASPLGGDPTQNRVVLTSKDTQIVAVDAGAGGHRVVIDFGNYIDITSLAVVGNTVYAGAEDNSVNAIDLASGTLLWETPLGRYEVSSLAHPRVVISDGVFYATGIPGVLAAREITQAAVRWDYAMNPSGETDSYYSQVGKTLVTSDRVFVGTYDSLDTNYLHAIDRATGARVWRIELPDAMSGTPKLAGGLLIVPAGDLYALDPVTAEVRWSVPMEPLSRGAGTPSIAGDAILVQGADDVADGRLYCIDLATGTKRWSIDAGNDYAGVYTPAVVNGAVIGVSERGSSQWPFGNGLPFVVDIATGATIWSNSDVSVDTSPVFANGRLYFHGQNFKGTGGIDDNVGLLTLDATTGSFLAIDNYFRYSSAVTPLVIADNGVFTAP